MSVIFKTAPVEGPLRAGFYSRQELADELGTSIRTLDRWFAHREGPPRIAVGKLIMYRREAVREWLQSREVKPLAAE